MKHKLIYGNYILGDDGEIFSLKSWKFMKQHIDNKGYARVTLTSEGNTWHYRVHRLVAKYFIEESVLEVNHKDMNKLNNHVSNLELVTTKENVHHSLYNGIHNRTNRKLTYQNVVGIREDWLTGKYTCTELGKKYGVSRSQAHEIAVYKSWNIVPKGDHMAKAQVAAAKGKGGKKKPSKKKGY